MIRVFVFVTACLMVAANFALAEGIRLKSGLIKQGQIVGKGDEGIVLRNEEGSWDIPFAMISVKQAEVLRALPLKHDPQDTNQAPRTEEIEQVVSLGDFGRYWDNLLAWTRRDYIGSTKKFFVRKGAFYWDKGVHALGSVMFEHLTCRGIIGDSEETGSAEQEPMMALPDRGWAGALYGLAQQKAEQVVK